MRARLNWLLGMLLLLQLGTANAVIETYDFQDEETRGRFHILSQELRCPKCQNQNLADSDSQIAADLRAVLYEQLEAGKNDAEIVEFMRQRYGDFVLYKPLVQKNTIVLWFGPLVLIGIVALLLWWSRQGHVRTRAAAEQADEVEINASAEQAAVASGAVNKASERLLAMLLLAAVLLAVATSLVLYRKHGALEVMQLTDISQRAFAPDVSPEQQLVERAKLLAALNEWLPAHTEAHPSYASFLYMRGRLWLDRSDFARAADDYRKLLALSPDQDNLQVEFAQILYQLNGERVTPEIENALEQALRVNENNVIALGMLGLHAYQTEQFARAVTLWQRLLPMMPQGVPARAELVEAIARAQAKQGEAPAPVAAEQPATAQAPAIAINVQVKLAQVATQLAPEMPVFILLRAHQGPRMPLAVVKITVGALSDVQRLDSTNSPMMAQMDWSSIEQFEVVVRTSKNGSVQPQAGDFEVVSAPFAKDQPPASLELHLAKPLP